MCGNTTQDEGKLHFALVSVTFFCDLCGPQRNRSRDRVNIPANSCSFQGCDKSASALAQGTPVQEQALQAPGRTWRLSWCSHGTSILEPLDAKYALAHTRALHKHSVFFHCYQNSFQRPAQHLIFKENTGTYRTTFLGFLLMLQPSGEDWLDSGQSPKLACKC